MVPVEWNTHVKGAPMSDTEFFAKTTPFDPATEPAAGHGSVMLRLKADLVTAMKAGDAQAKTALRMAIAALQNAEVAGESVRALSEPEEIAVLTREVKTRRESAETYAAAGRPELADKETAEADYLSRYLPQPLTPDELSALVDEKVAALTAERGAAPTMKDMGTLVRAVNEAAAGRAEGSAVASLVKAHLAR